MLAVLSGCVCAEGERASSRPWIWKCLLFALTRRFGLVKAGKVSIFCYWHVMIIDGSTPAGAQKESRIFETESFALRREFWVRGVAGDGNFSGPFGCGDIRDRHDWGRENGGLGYRVYSFLFSARRSFLFHPMLFAAKKKTDITVRRRLAANRHGNSGDPIYKASHK
jgi:hypothetical protein